MSKLKISATPKIEGIAVTKDILNGIVKKYRIRKASKPSEQARKRLAIILADELTRQNYTINKASVLERCFYEYMPIWACFDCEETEYEAHIRTIKGGYSVDPLKISLPEGLKYHEDTIYKCTQILHYILQEIINGKGIKENTVGTNDVGGFKHKKNHAGHFKSKGLAVSESD